MDLRARRRQETDRLIRQSALELAGEASVDAISVEAICEKAGISQRTFFNYFPYKEAAFVLPPPPFPEDAIAAFLKDEGPLLELLGELFAAQALAWTPDEAMIANSRRAALGHPKIAALQFAAFAEFETTVAGFIASRLNRGTVRLEHHIVAGGVLGALRIILDDNTHSSGKQLAKAIRRDLAALALLSASAADKSGKQDTTGAKKKPLERVGK